MCYEGQSPLTYARVLPMLTVVRWQNPESLLADTPAEVREAAILEAALDAIITMDGEGRVVEFNPAAERIFGYPRSYAIGRDMADLIVPAHLRDAHRRGLRAAVAGSTGTLIGRRVTISACRADGTEFPAELTITRLDAETALFTGHVRDITERVRTEERLAHMAYHDPLTGLANRALLEEHLTRTLANARRSGAAAALLLLDLDDFKLVNDSFGHAVGDEILREVACRLADVLRAGDVLARHGGDEFLVLLAELGDEPDAAAEAVTGKLLAALHEPFAIAGIEFQIDATIGIALFPDDAADADELLRRADSALYAGKGGRHVSRWAAHDSDPRGRLSMTRRLRNALAQDELELHYQPVVELGSGDVVGVEALLRWRDGERGLVPPGEFLPVAEQTGIIEALGDWVVDEVCRQARTWSDAGLEHHIGFNVSLRQLATSRFARRLAARLDAHGLAPDRFIAEMTESATLRDPDRVHAALRELRAVGVRVAIDDFGAGYSSLGRLQEMPVDILKIDRALLRGRAASAMITAVAGLAKALGMVCIAEGIETAEQRDLARLCGCDLAQGFLLGRPAPAAEVEPLLRGPRLVAASAFASV